MKRKIMMATTAIGLLLVTSCNAGSKVKGESSSEKPKTGVEVPQFSADSTYRYIAEQVAFGPRVPNTEAHARTAEWLAAELKRHGAAVTVQDIPVKTYNQQLLKGRNIIGSFNPEQKERIMLFAHWDTRPYADEDADKSKLRTPIDGANDGGSGVGVLLEIARHLGKKQPNIGVDILFFDAEDYGVPSFHTGEDVPHSWALGSQYWSRRPHKAGYKPRYGILLDMVGGKNATFGKEGYSHDFAPSVLKKVWEKAQSLGHQRYFIDEEMGYLTDDHTYVNHLARIPSIDIVDYHPDNKNGFNDQWHTTNDTMEYIDKATLKAVGETVMAVIYNE